jgi:hypothetical protein
VLVKEKPTYQQAGTNHGGGKCVLVKVKTSTTAREMCVGERKNINHGEGNVCW